MEKLKPFNFSRYEFENGGMSKNRRLFLQFLNYEDFNWTNTIEGFVFYLTSLGEEMSIVAQMQKVRTLDIYEFDNGIL